MSYQFIFINRQPDVQQIQQMATTLAPREGQETTTTSSAPQVHQIALPAPGASSLRIRPSNPGPRPQTAPPGNLSIMPGPIAGAPVQTQVFFPILVLSQVRNALLGTRFQSPPTQSHDRPCHHRSNSGKDSKSLLRLHWFQETGVRNLGSMTPTVGT